MEDDVSQTQNRFPCPKCEANNWVFKGYDYSNIRIPMLFECGQCGYKETHCLFDYSVNGSNHIN